MPIIIPTPIFVPVHAGDTADTTLHLYVCVLAIYLGAALGLVIEGTSCYWKPKWRKYRDSFKWPKCLGFSYKHLIEIKDAPVRTLDSYEYKVKIISEHLYWLKWKLRSKTKDLQ